MCQTQAFPWSPKQHLIYRSETTSKVPVTTMKSHVYLTLWEVSCFGKAFLFLQCAFNVCIQYLEENLTSFLLQFKMYMVSYSVWEL